MAIIEIATRGTVVTVQHGLLSIGGTTVNLDDLDLILAQVPAVTFTGEALALLGRAGIELLICDHRHTPVSSLGPLVGGHVQSARLLRLQATLNPRKKQALWREIVRVKIRNQAALLESSRHKEARLLKLADAVTAGDPENREAQAARLYWPKLFGAAFRRHAEDDTNALLNFGYAVLRGQIGRHLHATGLHRSLGIHHDNAENDGNLADDLIEPYRPLVDALVLDLVGRGIPLDPSAKSALGGLGDWPVRHGGQWITCRTSTQLFCQSLKAILEKRASRLSLPTQIGSADDARRLAKSVDSGIL
ncbi:hypothetical protein JCM17960_00470 [Magnetospira thiophila]